MPFIAEDPKSWITPDPTEAEAATKAKKAAAQAAQPTFLQTEDYGDADCADLLPTED